MATIRLTFALWEQLPESFAGLGPNISLSFGRVISVANIEMADCSRLFRQLEAARLRIRAGSLQVHIEKTAPLNDSAVVAFVLGAFGAGSVGNSEADIDSSKSGIDYCPVFPDRDIQCDSRPEGHFVELAGNLIVTTLLAQCLELHGPEIGGVILRGRRLSNWLRLSVQNSCQVIDGTASLHKPVPCSRCARPYVTTKGVWISLGDSPYSEMPALDTAFYGHCQLERPLVISRATAKQVLRRVGRDGYTLDPVYSPGSAVALRVKSLMDLFSSLVEAR